MSLSMSGRAQLTFGQHMFMGLMLEYATDSPLSASEVVPLTAEHEENQASISAVRQHLNSLTRAGWLVKVDSPPTGRRGKPEVRYAPTYGSRRAWNQREAVLQRAYAEQQAIDDDLLA
jgi:hypothetical protein